MNVSLSELKSGIVGGLAVLLTLAGCSAPPKEASHSALALGTAITITSFGSTPPDLFDNIFARVLEIETRMSTSGKDYDTTELMEVNAAAGDHPVAVSPDTFLVIQEALDYSQRTQGAFNVAIEPLVKLWGIGTENEAIPDSATLASTLDVLDYHKVHLDPAAQTIYLEQSGMGVDVGGIAKGYAADEAAKMLRDAGVQHALLDFGGNILTIGAKPDGSSWRIGIQTPDATRGQFLGIAEITDLAAVTSGTYERFFVADGVRYHHILDSANGYPVTNGLESVTIVTASSILADVLSTSVFVMGLERGYGFVENLPGVEALFVTSRSLVYMTPGMQEIFTLTNDDFTLSEL